MKAILAILVLLGATNAFNIRSPRTRKVVVRSGGVSRSWMRPGFEKSFGSPSVLLATPSEGVAGPEPKYIVALGVLIAAALFDFFVVHHGHP